MQTVDDFTREIPRLTAEASSPQSAVLDGVRVALTVLSLRVVRFVTLGMAFTLFVDATRHPDPWRIVAASSFTILVNVPLWWKGEK